MHESWSHAGHYDLTRYYGHCAYEYVQHLNYNIIRYSSVPHVLIMVCIICNNEISCCHKLFQLELDSR